MSNNSDNLDGVSIPDLMEAVDHAHLRLVQSFDGFVLLNDNHIEVYETTSLIEIYSYAISYRLD